MYLKSLCPPAFSENYNDYIVLREIISMFSSDIDYINDHHMLTNLFETLYLIWKIHLGNGRLVSINLDYIR